MFCAIHVQKYTKWLYSMSKMEFLDWCVQISLMETPWYENGGWLDNSQIDNNIDQLISNKKSVLKEKNRRVKLDTIIERYILSNNINIFNLYKSILKGITSNLRILIFIKLC